MDQSFPYYLYIVNGVYTSCDGNSRISLIGRLLSSGYGSIFHNSGVREYLGSSGHEDISSFRVPGVS